MIDGSWRERDFSSYDIVYHVAGIAHADVGKVNEATKAKYYAINTDLAIEVCEKAKAEGVKEFIFMSSMIIYGDSAPYGKRKVVDEHTIPVPANFYGDSKLQADVAVRDLADDKFKVIVLRPPMIYGKGSKGNYPMLAKVAKKMPVFPDVDNERSMLHVDNLCEFLCQIMLIQEVKQNATVLIPQNAEWTKTSEMVKEIAEIAGNKLKLMGGILKLSVSLGGKMPGKIGRLINKAFGNSCYAHEMSVYFGITYQNVSLKESIKAIEGTVPSEEKYFEGRPFFNKQNYIKTRDLEEKHKALILASVASMIDLFNADNINILLNLGYEVDVATNFEFGSITSQNRVNEYKQELIDRNIEVYHVPIPRSLSMVKEIVVSYKMIKNLVNKNQYQIVHCHSPIGGVICRMACRDARKKYGTKVIYTAHGFHFFEGASKKAWMIFYPIEKFCSNFTDVLITINQEDYKNAQKFHALNVEYVPGIGIHTDEFRNVEVDCHEKRKELGLVDDDFVFMSTGQISIRKNHEVIIRALKKIKNPKVKYLIVGFGELEEDLKKLSEELNLKDRVVFAGYRGDVNELLHVVDAYVFPSLQEGLPVSLMEAMAVGLPVICSRIRGNVDLIENGRGGFIYDCYDIDGFVEGMKKIIDGAGSQMGTVNIETMKKFDISEVNQAMERIYKEV